jgi:hypothetical protein
MSVVGKVWDVLTTITRLEASVTTMAGIIKAQQLKIEGLTERTIRLESRLDTMMEFATASATKRLK